MCGVSSTFSKRMSGDSKSPSLPLGSTGNTSMAAPRMCFDSRAAASASMSTTVPREALMRKLPFFMRAICSAPIMFFVSGVSGTCRLTTSASASSSSSVESWRALPSGSLVSMS